MKHVRYPTKDDSVLSKFQELCDRVNDLINRNQELEAELAELRAKAK